MELKTQQERAATFREMHHGTKILILPNAWDVASARIFEAVGFGALGTTSAGVAASLGYPDGQRIPLDDMLRVVRRIAEGVMVPVTADIEAGFGVTEGAVAETVTSVIRAGAIGINLEDGTDNPESPLIDLNEHAAKVGAAKQAARSADVPIVINARTDVYLLEVGERSSRLQETVRRANSYLEAGADCVFVPGLGDAEVIAMLVREVAGPINILAGRGVPTIPELVELGVARVSVGSGLMRAALAFTKSAAEGLLSSGTYCSFTEHTISYAELNKMLSEINAGIL
ncbi:MAG TPA: isocitrate lyase/phosphoenolpyruvate mutase family protein [Pyrinomonadaceae bacterium]|jgi:2-methylisocitrate lyase-like PEP mutase family enzyme